MDIEVTTSDSVVLLAGNVDSKAEHDLAINLARNTEDVVSVVDKLEVIQ